MILLDTNVISETMRPQPAASVAAWLDAQPLETLHLAAISVAELRAGVAVLPAGRRRQALHEHLESRVLPLFASRVLPFGMDATTAYAQVLANARKAGSGIQTADAYIAATALAHGFAIATRDESPFIAAGLTVINPWN